MLKNLPFVFLFFFSSKSFAQQPRQLIDSARFYKNSNYTKTIALAQSAYKEALLNKQPKLLGEAAYLTGVGNYLSGNYDEALHWYFEAEKVYTNLADTKGLTELYADMCVMYLKLGKFESADIVIKKAIAFSTVAKDTAQLATTLNNRGLIFLDKGLIDSATFFFTASLNLYKSINSKIGMAYSLDYLSSAQSEKADYKNSLVSLNESIRLRKGLGDKTGEALATNNIGEIYLKQKLPQKATPYFLETIKMAHQINFIDLEMYAYNMLSQTYELQHKYQEAFTAQTQYIALNKKVQDEKKTKVIEELQTKYETSKKEQQIKSLNYQSTIQQLQISKKNSVIYIIATGFLLALFSSWQFYKRYKSRQENRLKSAIIQQQDIASKGIIDAEERERKRIAGDLHDGVGQLFSTVKMNMEILAERFLAVQPDATILAKKTLALIDESCAEVRSIAHQIMPNALIKSGLVSALRDFINKIPSDKLKISVEAKGLDERLENNMETVLYRVIQESVNNVIKHAQATELDIVLLCDAEEITVSIEDNGKGFDMKDVLSFTGIGLKNMASRIEFLKGSFEVSSKQGKGTLVAIHIPIV